MEILVIISLGLLTLFLTFVIRTLARRFKIIDVPNERSLHIKPTPSGGGLAIIASWYTGITVFYIWGHLDKGLYFALMSGIILAFVSFIDDLIRVKPVFRLIIQFLTVIFAFYFLQGLRPLVIPGFDANLNFIVYPVAIIGMVWFINLFNFMDGIDGYASLEAILVSLILFLFSGDMYILLFVACLAGFLFWNWPKAKIFLGDVGSTQLGFVLAVFGIYLHNTFKFSILNWIMLTSPFWFDATYTLYRRWRNGEKLSMAHKKHAYQRIVHGGFSHQKVNLILIFINSIILGMILLYREYKILQIPIFIVSLGFYFYITRLVDKRIPFK